MSKCPICGLDRTVENSDCLGYEDDRYKYSVTPKMAAQAKPVEHRRDRQKKSPPSTFRLITFLFYIAVLVLGGMISAIGFRYHMPLQRGAALTSVVLSLVYFILEFLRTLFSQGIRQSLTLPRLCLYIFIFFFGVGLPLTILYDPKEWIWQENVLVGIVVIAIVESAIYYLAVPPAFWVRGNVFQRFATHKESSRHFRREQLMMLVGLITLYFIAKEIISLTEKDRLLLDAMIRYIKQMH